MKGIGYKVYEKGADEAVSRLLDHSTRRSKVTGAIYGFRFTAQGIPERGDRWFQIRAMTDQSYKAGEVAGEKVGEVRYTNKHAYYYLLGKKEPYIV